MLRRALFSTLVLGGLLAQSAQAATVSVRSAGPGLGRVVEVTDPPGQANALTLSLRDRTATFRDASAPLTAGRGCRPAADGAVSCVALRAGGERSDESVALVQVELGAGDDLFRATGTLGGFLDGVPTIVAADGGPGNDRLDVSGLLGARLSRGEPRLPELTAPSLLNGGDGDDVLIGAGGEDLLRGGAGQDLLQGGPGGDDLDGDGTFPLATLLDGDRERMPAPTPTAPDRLDGGPGHDRVTYAGRRAPVAVDLSVGQGGSPGEADRLLSVEDAEGGEGPATLRGTAGENQLVARARDPANRLDGGDGDDKLVAHGAGQLDGGRGDDVLADVGAVLPDCGSGRDVVVPSPDAGLDARQPGSCERVQVGRLTQVLLKPGVRLRGGRVLLAQRVEELDTDLGRTLLPDGTNNGGFTLRTGGRIIARGELFEGARTGAYKQRARLPAGATAVELRTSGTFTALPTTPLRVLLRVRRG